MIGQKMSEAASSGSFDIWRQYMGGRPHPEGGGDRGYVNQEEMVSATGEPIADEEVRRDEHEQSVVELQWWTKLFDPDRIVDA
jgi:hypothetical protein